MDICDRKRIHIGPTITIAGRGVSVSPIFSKRMHEELKNGQPVAQRSKYSLRGLRRNDTPREWTSGCFSTLPPHFAKSHFSLPLLQNNPFLFPMTKIVKLDESKTPSTVAYAGCTGNYGQGMCVRALELGVKVRAITRSPEKLKELQAKYPDQLSLHEVALDDVEGLTEVFSGTDGFISAMGYVSADKKVKAPRDHEPEFFKAMSAAGIKRYVALNTLAASVPGEGLRPGSWLMDGLFWLAAPSIFRRETRGQIDRLFGGQDGAADIEWTLMRVASPVPGSFSGGCSVSDHSIRGFTSGTRDMGDFALYCLTDDNAFIHQAPLVVSAGKVEPEPKK